MNFLTFNLIYGGYSLAVEQRVVVPLVRVQLPVATHRKIKSKTSLKLEKFLVLTLILF